MTWLLSLTALLFLADGLKLRRRLLALRTAPAAPDTPHDGFALVCAPGVQVDDDARSRAVAWARANDLALLDLVPTTTSTWRALSLATSTDLPAHREDRHAPGRTAGYALLVSDDLAARAGLPDITDAADLAAAARHLTTFASTDKGFAAVPGVRGPAPGPVLRGATLREVAGDLTPAVLGFKGVLLGLLVAGLASDAWPAALVAVAVFHLQPAIAVSGTALRPPDRLWVGLLRLPLELVTFPALAFGAWRRSVPTGDLADKRRHYDARLARGLDPLFEPRRGDCPVCGSAALSVHVRAPDLVQAKPGTFTLERCDGCGHVFQNPRLSLDGLDFYYGDFYDGLGERGMEALFGQQREGYLARARMVTAHTQPGAWLDVGCGHGHFAHAAAALLPDTDFDGLDLADSVLQAERRGWVRRGLRALFPDADLAGAYDVVSMSHYLEHTRDPRAELAAAARALLPGGHLLIEVPDPTSVMGRVLGRLWLPWFQPQHQHLLSRDNLAALLDEAGFDVVEVHTAEAHQVNDLTLASFLAVNAVAPRVDFPWTPPAGWLRRARRRIVAAAFLPIHLAAAVGDQLLAPVLRATDNTNTYRVLARKRGRDQRPDVRGVTRASAAAPACR